MNSSYELLRTMTDDDLRDILMRNTRKACGYEYLRCGAAILRELYVEGSILYNQYSADADAYRNLAKASLRLTTVYEEELRIRGLLPKKGEQHEEEMQATRTQMSDQEGEIPEAGTWIVKGIQSYPHVKTYPVKKGDKS